MSESLTALVQQFIPAIREHLEACRLKGTIEGYVCTVSQKQVQSASLFNGEKHSKAPLQVNTPFEVVVSLLLSDERSVGFTLESVSIPMFIRQVEFALSQAVKLEHRIQLRKQSSYPQIRLASDELLQLFSGGELSRTLLRILETTDRFAAKVSHPRLMSREILCAFARGDKFYFDSEGNFAQESSASCSVSCSYSLEDSSESHFDVFGILPTEKDLQDIVDVASKNLVVSDVRPLLDDASLPVVLTHKAVMDLLDQLVIPNLETRTLIDKTGAWDLGHIDKTVIRGLTVEDNPHLEGSPFSSIFDFEGTPTQAVKIVDNGRLVHPLMTSALLQEVEELHPEYAGRFKLTGHAETSMSASYSNLIFHLDSPPLDDLKSRSYVQIQNLTGMSIDPITGQFALDSDGAKVFENGRLKYSTSLTLRGNFFQALAHDSTRVGPLERHYNQWAPSLFTTALSCVSKELAQTFEEQTE